MHNKGLLIALEGDNPTYVSNNAKLLTERLISEGYKAIHIPALKNTRDKSYYINKYESGGYAPYQIFSPYTPSVFYALEHYDNYIEIKKAIDEGYVVICDQYVLSNFLTNYDEQTDTTEYIRWLQNLEYGMLSIPKPDTTFVTSDITNEIKEVVKTSYDSDSIYFVDMTEYRLTKTHSVIWENLKKVLESKKINVVPFDTKSKYEELDTDRTCIISEELSYRAILEIYALKRVFNSLDINVKESDLNYFNIKIDQNISDLLTKQKKIFEQIKDQIKGKYSSQKTKDILDGFTSLSEIKVLDLTISQGDLKYFIVTLAEIGLDETTQLSKKLSKKYKVKLSIPSKQNSDKNLSTIKGDTSKSLQLIKASPKNEIDLINDIQFTKSNDSITNVFKVTDKYNYQTKNDLLRQNFSSLKRVSYCFEAISSIRLLEMLIKSGFCDVKIQSVTPMNGYILPNSVDNDSLLDLCEEFFSYNIQLEQHMLSSNLDELVEYAAVKNNKARFLIYIDGFEILRLLDLVKKNRGLKKLSDSIMLLIKDTHPITYQTIIDSR